MKPVKLFGVVGKPLQHSLSPVLHNRMFKKHGLPYAYLRLELKPRELSYLRQLARLCDFWGFNVTAPYKQRILSYLDDLDVSARESGAVNTVVRRGRKWIGYNTDGKGWWQSVASRTRIPSGAFCLILGTGAAAQTLKVTLHKKGIPSCKLVERPFEKKRLEPLLAKTDFLVNATPAGQGSNPPLKIPLAALPKTAWCIDLVYGRHPSLFLKQAKKLHLKVLDGLPMLAYQACFSFALWTGIQDNPQKWLKEARRLSRGKLP